MKRADQIWQDGEIASRFLGVRTAFPYALDHPKIMLELLGTGRPIKRFVDVGCGAGFFSAAVHSRWPEAVAVLVDFSEPMLEEARKNLIGPAEVHALDLMSDTWPERLGVADAVVSGFAIHHLPHPIKQRVYRDIYALLEPGGWFVHIEHVASASSLGTELFDRQVVESLHRHLVQEDPALTPEGVANRYCDQCDQEANILAPVELQCDWLREIGYVEVDCYFKSYEIAIFAGRTLDAKVESL
ncbi:MAG: class I SAM-dependent methyltransferase [Planctomycetota bacterium]